MKIVAVAIHAITDSSIDSKIRILGYREELVIEAMNEEEINAFRELHNIEDEIVSLERTGDNPAQYTFAGQHSSPQYKKFV